MKSKRWTEADIQKLPKGMVEESLAKAPDILPQPQQHLVNQLVEVDEKSGKGAQHALGRLKNGEMNKTEARFAQLLELQKSAGEVVWWAFEPMNLRLGVNCYYRIDFMAMKADGHLIAYEVKGRWEDDALVKIRTAAEKFPWPFIAVRWIKGHWDKDEWIEAHWEYRNF